MYKAEGEVSYPTEVESEWDADSDFDERYGPMKRLLSDADVEYVRDRGALEAAKALRSQHRRLFLNYVTELEKEIRDLQRVRRDQIARGVMEDFGPYHSDAVAFQYHLLRLRVAANMHAWRLHGAHAAALSALRSIGEMMARQAAPAHAT